VWQIHPGQTFSDPEVEMVHGTGFDPHQNLIFSQLGIGNIFIPENFRATEFVEANGFHGEYFTRVRSLRLQFDFSTRRSNNHVVDIYEEIVKLRSEGRRGAVATIVNVRGSIPSFETAKMLIRDDGSIIGTVGGGCVEADVWQAAREVMESERPRTLTFNLNQNPRYDTGLVCGGTLDIFIEPVLPPASLFIFGAGHVALNLYRSAKNAGFDVIVVDDRENYANRERFPEAKEVIAEDFENVMARLSPSETSYIVIVTRGHRDDMRVLRWAVQTPARYVGMIGSKRKTITIFRELVKEGLAEHLFERVHAPVGLDIGAITPEEIAVAITAELIAARRRVERPLPHMSWFHSRKLEIKETAGESTKEEA
jgi:xanthine dehydrogenase accessory factor